MSDGSVSLRKPNGIARPNAATDLGREFLNKRNVIEIKLVLQVKRIESAEPLSPKVTLPLVLARDECREE